MMGCCVASASQSASRATHFPHLGRCLTGPGRAHDGGPRGVAHDGMSSSVLQARGGRPRRRGTTISIGRRLERLWVLADHVRPSSGLARARALCARDGRQVKGRFHAGFGQAFSARARDGGSEGIGAESDQVPSRRSKLASTCRTIVVRLHCRRGRQLWAHLARRSEAIDASFSTSGRTTRNTPGITRSS